VGWVSLRLFKEDGYLYFPNIRQFLFILAVLPVTTSTTSERYFSILKKIKCCILEWLLLGTITIFHIFMTLRTYLLDSSSYMLFNGIFSVAARCFKTARKLEIKPWLLIPGSLPWPLCGLTVTNVPFSSLFIEPLQKCVRALMHLK